MLVRESLDRFALLNEDFLAENIMNEKISINSIVDTSKRLAVLASMFVMFAGGKAPEIKNSLPDKDTIARTPIMLNMADEDFLDRDEIFTGFENLLNLYRTQEKIQEEKPRILSAGAEGFIEAVNKIKSGRLDSAQIAHYDQYDDDILRAIDNLEARGEDPNRNLIKAIMLIETGMKPVKNSIGYEGFPQTKQHIIDGINKKNGTSFTMKDMYDAEKSAEFIHYFLKTTSKSDYVSTLEDLIIAYNWGIGNLKKYKHGEKDLPDQTADYIKLVASMQDYFVS